MDESTSTTATNISIRGGIFKSILFDLDPPDNIMDNLDPSDEKGQYSTSYLIMIGIPLFCVGIIMALAASIRWRYNIRLQVQRSKNNSVETNNNDRSIIEESRKSNQLEEVVPLKYRSASTSSSSSTNITANIVTDGALPVTVDMRIVTETHQKSVEDNRMDLYYEIKPTLKAVEKPEVDEVKEILQNTVEADCDVLSERAVDSRLQGCDNNSSSDSVEVISELASTEGKVAYEAVKRPKTLQVMKVSEGNESCNLITQKGSPWSEQLWTPDADIIEEDTESPCTEHRPNLPTKENSDCLYPLSKLRFKMKPKGLLERRGSNVALTISLKNEDKPCSSPPPSSKSPKPLFYLRTASAKLNPSELHIKSSDMTKLQQEFWEVPMNHPSEKHFRIPGYGTKNRYRSILPNPHSRVLLPATPSGDPLSAYINANYIRGYSAIPESERRKHSEDGKENDARRMSIKRKAAFIATQGPMANTIGDFWKMVWKENTNAVVMITKLKERKEKCAEYIPSSVGETRTYDDFEIEVKYVRFADHYTVRTIELRNKAEDSPPRTILHYWYSEWLDHETPEKLRGLVKLVQEVELKCPDRPGASSKYGPVVIHCSAGIGRTGCFIAISIGCRQLREEGKVDVLRIICQLRMDRGGMIQTWEQYQYVHVALSRYARMLAGENVETPLTCGSTPSSRGSSSGTDPEGSRVLSPGKQTNMFLPKSDLTTVNEGPFPEGNDGDNAEGGGDRSIFSPQPVKPSRFSFSKALDIADDTHPTHSRVENTQNICDADVEQCNSNKNTMLDCKGKKKSLPPQLILKMNSRTNITRDENWLVNGHCQVHDGVEDQEPSDDCVSDNKPEETKDNRNGFKMAYGRTSPNLPPNECKDDVMPLHGARPQSYSDDTKTRSSLTPVDINCQNPAIKNEDKSIFAFPAPNK